MKRKTIRGELEIGITKKWSEKMVTKKFKRMPEEGLTWMAEEVRRRVLKEGMMELAGSTVPVNGFIQPKAGVSSI